MGFLSSIGDALTKSSGWLSGITPITDMAFGILGGLSQSDTNANNQTMSNERMAWEERMSNTAHQREVTDLKAAGLNPILSSKYGGASTPLAVSSTDVSPGIMYAEGGHSAASHALESKSIVQNIATSKAQERASSAQAISTIEDAKRKMMENDVLASKVPLSKREAEMRNRRSDSEVGFGTTMSDIFGTVGRVFSGNVSFK